MAEYELIERDGLPEALRVLVNELPRETWEVHPEFAGLVQFWLERHMMFRKLLGLLDTDVRAALEGQIDARHHAARLARFGGMLVNDLHGHHQIEDYHYFPRLRLLDPRIEAGFDILDRDHQAMDGLLSGFADIANAVIRAEDASRRDALGDLDAGLVQFAAMLDRHLNDEEDLIVPVILKSGGGGLA